jgi:hypothetical protein
MSTKEKGYNKYYPDLFKNLTNDEAKFLFEILEDSSESGKYGCFIISLISVFIICYYITTFAYEIGKNTTPTLFRILLIPIVIILAIGIKLAFSFKVDKKAGYVLKNDKRLPILYLRSFSDDAEPGIENISLNMNLGKIAKLREVSEVNLTNKIKKFGPVVSLCKARNEDVRGVSNKIIVKNINWKKAITILIKSSSLIAFLVTKNVSESISWELSEIFKFKKKEEIIFFVPNYLNEDCILRFILKINTLSNANTNLKIGFSSDHDYFLVYNSKMNIYQKNYNIRKFLKDNVYVN